MSDMTQKNWMRSGGELNLGRMNLPFAAHGDELQKSEQALLTYIRPGSRNGRLGVVSARPAPWNVVRATPPNPYTRYLIGQTAYKHDHGQDVLLHYFVVSLTVKPSWLTATAEFGGRDSKSATLEHVTVHWFRHCNDVIYERKLRSSPQEFTINPQQLQNRVESASP